MTKLYIKNFAQCHGQRAEPILCIYFQPIVVFLDTFFNSGQYISLRVGADEKAWCLARSRHLSKAIVGTQPVLRQTTVFIIYLLFIIHQETIQKVYIKYKPNNYLNGGTSGSLKN